MAQAGRRRIDQPRKAPMQTLPAVAELLHRAGTEILDDDIGAREQRIEDALVRLVLEIEGDRLFAAVDRHEVARLAVEEWAVVAPTVPPPPPLHPSPPPAPPPPPARAIT